MLPDGLAELRSTEPNSQESISALTITPPPCIGRDGKEHRPGDIWVSINCSLKPDRTSFSRRWVPIE